MIFKKIALVNAAQLETPAGQAPEINRTESRWVAGTKKPPRGGRLGKLSISIKKLKALPSNLPNPEYIEPRGEVHRIEIFFQVP
jgi:hypothetical protein